MNIELEEYIRGSRVRLVVDDAPMTAMRSLVSAFVTACDTVEEHYEPVEYDMSRSEAQREINRQRSAFVEEMAQIETRTPESDAVDAEVMRLAEQNFPEQKRKRRTKAEMEAARAGDAPTAAQVQEATEIAQSVETVVEAITSLTAEAEPPLPFDAGSAEAEQPVTVEEPSDAATPTDTAEVTDTELQRYCGRLAQHFGGAQKVFDLSKDFVPADAVARPTNIKDNAQRWAFIRHAEEASGVKYHG